MIGDLLHLFMLIGIVASALYVYIQHDLLSAAVATGLFSFLLSLEFYILQAPDVAISQAAIGAGLTTAIFIIAIRRVGRWEGERR